MPITRPGKLSNPATDQMRDIFWAESSRRSRQFGRNPVGWPGRQAEGWIYVSGAWLMSCAWLPVVDGRPANHGFRVSYNGEESFTLEVWSPGRRMVLTLSSGFDAAVLRRAVSMVFGP